MLATHATDIQWIATERFFKSVLEKMKYSSVVMERNYSSLTQGFGGGGGVLGKALL